MALKVLDINEASVGQLRSYATEVLNLDVASEATDADIRSAIERAQPGIVSIIAQEADPQPESAGIQPDIGVSVGGGMQGSLGKGDPRAIIEIQIIETDDGKGGEDVYVGVNGRGWQLKRGVALDVPWRVVCALDNAVQTIVRHSQDEGREGEVITREAKRFPYIFHTKPSQAEIDDWQKRSGDVFCA